ncbi:MAG: hypothetical protein WCP39_00875 [Chlamydiota bacterium]
MNIHPISAVMRGSCGLFSSLTIGVVGTAKKVASFVQKHPILIFGIISFVSIGLCSARIPPHNEMIPFPSKSDLKECLENSLDNDWIREKGIIYRLVNIFGGRAFSKEGYSINLREVKDSIAENLNVKGPMLAVISLHVKAALEKCRLPDFETWAIRFNRTDLLA